MSAEDQIIEGIRNKNRQIEMMLDQKGQDTYSSEEEAEGEYYEEEGKELIMNVFIFLNNYVYWWFKSYSGILFKFEYYFFL